MTCVRDRREHAVSEWNFALGVADGLYRASCGHLVMPRALVSPCGPRCPACVAALERCAAAEVSARPTRRGRGHGWVWRLAAAPRWVLSCARGVRGLLGRHQSE